MGESCNGLFAGRFTFFSTATKLVNRLTEQGGAYTNPCTHCNRCAALIKDPGGVRCVEVQGEPGSQ